MSVTFDSRCVLEHDASDVGVGMHHVDETRRGKPVREAPDRADHALERLAEALAPVRRDENEVLLGDLAFAARNVFERVHYGVAGEVDLLRGNLLGLEGPGRPPRRNEVGFRHEIHDAAIHLLGEGMLEVARAEPRLDVPDAHPSVERREGGGHRRGRVALDEEPVRRLAREHVVETGEDARGERVGRLVGAHQVEVDVRREAEESEHLVEHFAMLRGRAEDHGRTRLAAQAANDRSHLDGLGPCSDDDEQLHEVPT